MGINFNELLEKAIHSRRSYIRSPYNTGFRLCNGFQEGIPNVVIDIFAKTIVFHDYSNDETLVKSLLPLSNNFYLGYARALSKKDEAKDRKIKLAPLFLVTITTGKLSKIMCIMRYDYS